MNMPTPCPRCGDIVELNRMKNIGNELFCEDCYEELEESK